MIIVHFLVDPTGCAIDLECFNIEMMMSASAAVQGSEPPPVDDNAFFACLHCSAAPMDDL